MFWPNCGAMGHSNSPCKGLNCDGAIVAGFISGLVTMMNGLRQRSSSSAGRSSSRTNSLDGRNTHSQPGKSRRAMLQNKKPSNAGCDFKKARARLCSSAPSEPNSVTPTRLTCPVTLAENFSQRVEIGIKLVDVGNQIHEPQPVV